VNTFLRSLLFKYRIVIFSLLKGLQYFLSCFKVIVFFVLSIHETVNIFGKLNQFSLSLLPLINSYYFRVWGKVHRHWPANMWTVISNYCWEVAAAKISKKIESELFCVLEPHRKSQAHSLSEFTTLHITCTCSPIITHRSARKAEVASRLYVTVLNCLTVTNIKWKQMCRIFIGV